MKPPNTAPAYVQHYLRATEIARTCGYALAIHGTMARDLDVVAVPWTEEAVAAEVLVEKLCEEFAWVIRSEDGTEQRYVVGPTPKSHGRVAWLIPLMGCSLDLSVMPRASAPAPVESAPRACLYCGKPMLEHPMMTTDGEVACVGRAPASPPAERCSECGGTHCVERKIRTSTQLGSEVVPCPKCGPGPYAFRSPPAEPGTCPECGHSTDGHNFPEGKASWGCGVGHCECPRRFPKSEAFMRGTGRRDTP